MADGRGHHYRLEVTWTGNTGSGTSSYRDFRRDHEVRGEGKPVLLGSSDPAFRGDPSRYNPEELLVAALSECHLLWFLHLAAMAGVVVTAYTDHPEGTMTEHGDGSGEFTGVVLRPEVTVAEPEMVVATAALHDRAHEMCFIARSVNFPVRHQPSAGCVRGDPAAGRADAGRPEGVDAQGSRSPRRVRSRSTRCRAS